MPAFLKNKWLWIGLILIFVFAVNLGLLPAGGRGETVMLFGVEWSFLTGNGLMHMLLPAINLALFKLALLIRLARAGTREVMLTDTVRFARAAGESEWTIIRHHVLRLIAIPLVTVFGLELGSTLAFAPSRVRKVRCTARRMLSGPCIAASSAGIPDPMALRCRACATNRSASLSACSPRD
jgi:hypothetical protein